MSCKGHYTLRVLQKKKKLLQSFCEKFLLKLQKKKPKKTQKTDEKINKVKLASMLILMFLNQKKKKLSSNKEI